MIASMTGFGRKRFLVQGIQFTAEIRTLNHRHLDIHCRLPEVLFAMEMPVRNLVKKHLNRGRVDIRISMEIKDDNSLVQLNKGVYQAYSKILKDICIDHNISSFDPVNLLSLPNVLTSTDVDFQEIQSQFLKPLEDLLVKLHADRCREGEHLWQDILEKHGSIQTSLVKLNEFATKQQKEVGQRFSQRLERLDESLDDSRILTEIAILVDKSDINEELVRLDAHLQEFACADQSTEPVGRRLEFLGQEMLRETNTIAAKSALYDISKLAVDIKTQLEKIREQVQNIE